MFGYNREDFLRKGAIERTEFTTVGDDSRKDENHWSSALLWLLGLNRDGCHEWAVLIYYCSSKHHTLHTVRLGIMVSASTSHANKLTVVLGLGPPPLLPPFRNKYENKNILLSTLK